MAAVEISLADDLHQQIEQIAREQNCQPAEVLEEAVRKYLEKRSWVAALEYGRERADAVGVTTEEGIDRAIADWRKHNSQSTP